MTATVGSGSHGPHSIVLQITQVEYAVPEAMSRETGLYSVLPGLGSALIQMSVQSVRSREHHKRHQNFQFVYRVKVSHHPVLDLHRVAKVRPNDEFLCLSFPFVLFSLRSFPLKGLL